jgi:beta-glucosidase
MRRRDFLAGTAALTAGTAVLGGSARAGDIPRFPEGFVWGCSTAAYQVEGAAREDGRGPSVWDVFSHTPRRIANNDTGDVACDHYHRYPEDLDLMAKAGMKAYRFSVSWPRVLPEGTGAVNPKGLDFYDRLTDAALARGIEPWPCLFHWDTPQALEFQGGWRARDIADRFTDYALIVARRLGDRVNRWVMLNEPCVVSVFGYGLGGHAPGVMGRANAVAAQHHLNLAQGKALAALRAEARPSWKLGTVLTLQPTRPAGGLEQNREAAAVWDAVWNRACLDPLFKGHYPARLEADYARVVKPGDLEAIRQPVDFLGLNYYSRMHHEPHPGGLYGTGYGAASGVESFTGMGWPVEPDGLIEALLDLKDNYGNPPVYLTENGADYPDTVGADGTIADGERTAFIRDHLLAGHRAIQAGANLKGWLLWTLLDNFEWAEGYSRRFGIVAVDRQTLARTPKASYRWYAEAIRQNGVPPLS